MEVSGSSCHSISDSALSIESLVFLLRSVVIAAVFIVRSVDLLPSVRGLRIATYALLRLRRRLQDLWIDAVERILLRFFLLLDEGTMKLHTLSDNRFRRSRECRSTNALIGMKKLRLSTPTCMQQQVLFSLDRHFCPQVTKDTRQKSDDIAANYRMQKVTRNTDTIYP